MRNTPSPLASFADIAKALESIDQKMQEFSVGASRAGCIAGLVADLVHQISAASADQVYRARAAELQARSTGKTPATPGSAGGPATPKRGPVVEPQTQQQTRTHSELPPQDNGVAAAEGGEAGVGNEAAGVPLPYPNNKGIRPIRRRPPLLQLGCVRSARQSRRLAGTRGSPFL